jgi:predicted Fe-Mo cluster-binding NifX family protein
MKVAIPVWNGRVSPVLDVAKSIRIVVVEHGKLVGVETLVVRRGRLASMLADVGVDVLVCAAVSAPLEATLWMSGVEVISDVCGNSERIVEALAAGDVELEDFRSPGSRRKPRRLSGTRSNLTTSGSGYPN